MPVSIEFQIAGFITTLILIFAFYKKVKWSSPQNTVYKILLAVTFIEIGLDIVSVILIDHRDEYPIANNILAKAYLVSMLLFILTVDIYTMLCTFDKSQSKARRNVKYGVMATLCLASLVITILILSNTLYYTGYGRKIYSYGFPSDLIYLFSTVSVVYVILTLLINVKHIPLPKLLSIFSFCIMEGTVAIIQMFNRELLLVGFGSAICVFIMYFTVENPDAQAISRLSKANRRARDLLRNVSVNQNGKAIDPSATQLKIFPDATVMYLDIVDYSRFATRMGVERFAKYISNLFDKIDSASDAFNVEKLKNVGSVYQTIAGIPEEYSANTLETVRFATEIMNILRKSNAATGMNMQFRIGIANGAVLANLVGKQSFIYNIFGTPVNLASLLQADCEPDRVHVSESVYEKLKDRYDFKALPPCEYEGLGRIPTYQLEL